MKLLNRLLFTAALILAIALPARANVHQATGLGASAATLVIPGPNAKVVIIQDNGANNVRISIDGGSTYINPTTGVAGTDPTASTGFLLVAGKQVIISMPPGSAGLRAPIRGIMVSGSTTLDIITDDTASTFPQN